MASKTYFSDAYAKYNAQHQKTQQRQSESSTSASQYRQSTQPQQNYAQSKYQEWLASRGKSDTHDESAVPLASETKNYREDTLHPLLHRQLTDLGTRGEKLYGDTARYVSSADSSRDQWDYRSYIEQVNSYMDELRRAKVKYGSSSSASDYLAALEKDFGNLSDALYGQKDLLSQLPTGVSYGVPGRAPTYEEARQNWRTARSDAQMDNKGDWSALVADAPVYGPTLPEEEPQERGTPQSRMDTISQRLAQQKADRLSRTVADNPAGATRGDIKNAIGADRAARKASDDGITGERQLGDKIGYGIEMAGAGTLRQPTSISAGLVDTAALLTGNGEEYGNGYAALDYAAQVDPEVSALVNTLARTGGRDPKIARQISQRTGVSEDVVTNYGIHLQPEYSRQMVYDRYPQLSTETRDRIGDMAYQLGDQFVTTAFQIIGSYGYGLAPVEGNGLFNQLIRGAEGGVANAKAVGGNLITGALKGAGASAKDAVKGALVGSLKMPAMWMSVASDAAFQQLRQTGYNPQAYTNGFLQGFGESFTENLFGLNGTALDDMLSTMSTSFGKNLAKNVINYALSGAEEGLEEIINVPLGGLFEKMTVDADKPIFGDGGLFDVKEMWKSGVSGAEMGLILGGVSALTAVTAARGSAINIAEQARQLNALVDAMPEAYRPAKVTPEFTDSASVETLRASILDGYQRYYADVAQKNQRLIQQIYHSRGEDISEADAARIMQTYTDLGYGENGISAFVALAPGGEDLNSYTYAFDRVYRAGVTGQEISDVEDLLPADEAYMVYAAGIDDSASEAVRNAVQDRLPVTEEETQETTSAPSQEAVEAPTAAQSSMPSNDTAERAEPRNAQEEPQKTAQNASQDNGSASLDSTDLFQFVGNVSKEGKTAISGAFEMYRQSGGEMSADSFGRSADTVYAIARDLGGSQAVRGSILGSISDKRAAIALQAVFDQGAADRTVKAAPTTRKSTGTVRAATEEELTRVKITGAKVVDLNAVDNRVSAEVKALQKIGQKLGVDFVIYESVADENGVRSADNGLYDPSTNAIYLDVHAGIASNESMLRTAGHELTHFIQRWSPEEYDKLRQLVVDRYIGKNNALLDKRVAQKVTEYRAHGVELTTDGAIDEIVADACEMMLRDPEAMNWISEQDKTLKDKIADWIREFVQMIKDAFEGVTSLSREAKDMLDDMEDLQKAWNSGIQSAGERSSSAAVELTETQKSQAESNDFGIVVQDGAAVSAPVAEIMRSPDYHPPVDPIGEAIRQSVRTRPAWVKAYLEYYGNSEEQQKVVDALNRFTDNMIMDREIMDFVPTGDYTHTTMGPIRANQEYHVTIDMDASCPRTFQFAAYRDRIQKLGNRMLTYKESINLLELMRAYGQMIPCSYCYLENKRVLLAGSYNNFFNFRQNVINAKTDAEARKLMYSYNAKKGTLSKPAQAAMERWRTSEKDYNPTIEEVWSASATSRNSVLNYLDNLYSDNLIGKNSSQTKVIDQVLRHFSIDESYKGAVAEISNFVADWFYDTIAEIPHVYQTDNDRLAKTVDQKALNLNHEALGYAKSASSARNVDKYIPYTDQIKNIPPDVKAFINAMGGIRKHSSNDFRLDYVQDYFMIFADLAAEGYFGHTYTKNIDYAKIFGRTGDRINMSIAMVDNKDGTVGMNLQEGADWNEVKSLVENYPDVGAMAMVTSNNQLAFALNSDWITMIIPFHASSLDKAVWYNLRAWFDYTSKQNERPYNAADMKKALKSRDIPFPKNAKSQQIKEIFEAEFKPKHLYKEDGTVARPHFFPDDTIVNGQVVPGHHNDAKRYFELCREYAVHPRFDGIMIPDGKGGELNVIDHPGYVKLIKETSRTDTEQRAIQFNFDEEDPYLGMTPFEYAMQRMKEEAKNGGYGNVQQDAFGIVDEFMSQYFGKNRPIGYLTERAKNAVEVMEEMREDQLKFDVSGNEVRHSVRNTEQTELSRENRSLQAKVRSLQKQLAAAKAQTKLSDREAVREADLNRLASVYIREYGLKMKRADLVEQIRGIASAVVRDPAWESAVNAAEPVARGIVSQLNGDAEDVEQAVEELRNILIEDVTNNIRYVPKTFADRQAEKVSSLRQELKEANSAFNTRVREIDKLEKELAEAERRSLASDMAKGTQLYEERKEAEATIKDLSSWIKKQEKKIARLEREITEAERRSLSAEEAHKKALARVTQKYETLQQRRHQQVLSERKKKILNAVKGRVKELDQMVRSPSDKSHVPEYLKKTAIEIISWFAPESEIFGRRKKTSGAPPVPETALARTGEDNFTDDPTIDFDAVGKVIYAYEKLISDEEVNYADIVDPDVTGMLQHIQETLSNNYANGSHLSDLPYEDISDIKTILDNLYHIIKHGNAVFLNGRRVNAFELASLLTDDMMQRGTHTSNFLTRTQLAQFIAKGNITPYYFFKNAGGVLNDLYGNLMEGQRAYGREIIKAKKRVRQIMEKYHYDQWSEANKPAGKKTRIQFTTENGDELNVTLEEALSLYATHKRETANVEQESKHLSAGGFVTESAVRSEKKGGKIIGIEFDDTRPIKLTYNDTVKLASMLTEEQRQYADEMVSYISKDMSDLGNEVSMKLYGYKKFLEKYYFPYETQSEYKAIRLDQPDTVSQIKNVSFSKKTVKGAASPLVIRGFTDTVLGHIAGMVNYYSEAIPQDTMMRVLNFKFRREEAEAMDAEYGTRAPRNVQTAITNAMGKESLQYITQLMRDMFNGPHNGGDILGRMLSSFKKSAVMASLSVTIQQPSSIARVLAYLAPKYFAVKSPTKSTWDELERYSGTAVIKRIGSFDVATSRSTARWLAEPDTLGEQMKTGKVLDTIDDIASYGPEMMDRITWLRIWSAVKAETKAKYPNYTTEQMLTEAGKRFDEIINATQVYDSVLSKSQMMRQKDFGSKMVTSFMAEPTISYNLLVDAFRKGQSGRYRAKALGSFVAAGVLNAILKSFVQALRKSSDKDRDYIERYAAELASNLAGAPVKIGEVRIYGVGSELSPLTMLPVIRDIIEIMQGYEVERSDMSPVSDVYKSVQKAISDTSSAEDVIQNVVTVVSYLTGVPAKNVYRDVEAIVRECLNPHNAEKDRTWQSVMDSITAEMGVFGSKTEQYADIVSGWIDGKDMTEAIDRLKRGGTSSSDIKSDIKKAIEAEHLVGRVSDDLAIELLDKAGDESPYKTLDIWKANAEWNASGNDGEKPKDTEKLYGDLYEAFYRGEDISDAVSDRAKRYGVAKDTVWGNVQDDIKDRFTSGEISEDETIDLLKRTGMKDPSASLGKLLVNVDEDVYQDLFRYVSDGKEDAADEEMERLASEHSVDKSDIRAIVKDHIKAEFEDGNIDGDTAKKWLASAGFDQKATSDDSIAATVYKWETGDRSIYSHLYEILASGESGRSEVRRLKKEFGCKDDGIRDSIRSHYKEEYIASNAERRTQIRQEIYSTGLYSSADAVRDLCRGWLK